MTQSLAIYVPSSIDARTRVNGRSARQTALVNHAFESAQEVLKESRRRLTPGIVEGTRLMVNCFAAGNKALVCGNGGSAADGQHFAAELVGRLKSPHRPALPVIALTADSAILTAWSNDVGYETVFSRQVEALGRPGDLLLAISTSGLSKNLVRAVEAARRQRMHAIALLGGDGGDVMPLCDTALVVPSFDSQRIQEVQMLALHSICELIEEQMDVIRAGLFVREDVS
jgi:phosphoheptose isomerase